jgi:Reverse transcriptase (RNA-dependent DNA polymerase)
VDFEETFAPVSKLATLRVLLSVAARRGWKVHQIDIKTAFLNGPVDTDVYMMQPPGFVDGTNFVCQLKQCLYGLKQAPRQWYLTLSTLLRKLGFEPVPTDTSFWVKQSGCPVVVYLTSVVDDMLVTSADEAVTLAIIDEILRAFTGTHGGIAHHYDGMKISWLPEERAVVLTQHKHIEAMLDKYASLAPDWNPRKLPMKDGLKLHKNGTSDVLESEPLDVTVYPYRALVGSLNYVACTTRPDVAYAVNQLAKYSNAPMVAHWEVAIDCLRYLKGTKHWGLKLGSGGGPGGEIVNLVVKSPLEACAFADSNHATGIDDKRSVGGYVLQVYGGPVCWASRTQRLTSTSSTESEFRALSDCAKEVLWMMKLLAYFGIVPQPFHIFGDSQGAIQALKNFSSTKHTKHIEIHHDFMRERYSSGELNFVHIPGTTNPADIFTKALGRIKFEQFRRGLGMAPVQSV